MKRFALAPVLICGALFIGSVAAARAMPPFAQAYGVQCSVCHTQVPALNSYGRYVQRSGYASLDPAVLRRANPIWIGVNTSYDSQDPSNPHKTLFGNVALHAVGPIGSDWTYHVQQWLQQNNQAGGLDTLWVTYNNLFHRDGHVFVGKITSPGPSGYSQWFDLSGFASAEMTVGEHTYQLDGNRWGTKVNYTPKNFDAEIAYLASGQDIGGTSDFSNDTEKTIQWKLAYANPEHPTEYGFVGSRGSSPLASGDTDQYHSLAAFFQSDPTHKLPGTLLLYQTTYDANPGGGAPASAGNAATVEVYVPVLRKGLLALRKEFTNDGMGTQTQSGNIDFAYHVMPYLHFYLEEYLTQNNKPGFRYMVWWTTPVRAVK